MFKWLGNLVDSNEKVLKKLQPVVAQSNALEPEYEKLTDDELKAKTQEFRDRLAQATSDSQNRMNNARQELQDARKRVAEAQDKFTAESGELAAKQLQDRLELLEKELAKAQNEALDDLIPEAFAAVREASKRVTGLRHFDVQMMGGLVLHSGKIAEMKTGEGKTLVATLPMYLNALSGRGVHLVTVNDYLSKRDPYWMAPIYHALGMTVSSIQGQQTAGGQGGVSFLFDPGYDTGKEGDPWKHFKPITRQEAYLADITYGTNNEFGFDYLRDNMVVDPKQCVQRELNYAIVDEVDNILIDEARTPLIISGPAEKKEDIYKDVDSIVKTLKYKLVNHEGSTAEEKEEEKELLESNQFDYVAFEKEHIIRETLSGREKFARSLRYKVEDLFGKELEKKEWLEATERWEEEQKRLPAEEKQRRSDLVFIMRQSMMAYALYSKDKEYLVDGNEVIIVDEFTGRKMHGRRYSEGLHQAIEAKEQVRVQQETRTYATVTFQNYFRMYQKLAGMTGTALTEAEEFHKIYKLDVVVIPTNKPSLRNDLIDKIYKNEQAKFNQVVQAVEELHKEGRPILIGTVSVEKSEVLSGMMKRKGIKHEVLNAKLHEKEAYIVAQAGRLGAVTVATNMAGRGVDIVLGGKPDGRDPKEWQKEHDEVVQKGGLHIIGTERHEARRIDNQLRGRAGRQGDPGSTRFYVSLEDDIMRQFGGDRVGKFMEWAGLGEDVPIENSIVNKTIESAQVRVEGFHFDIRKHLVEYDDVVNNQRQIIYGERRKIIGGADLKANVLSMVDDEIAEIITEHIGENRDGDLETLVAEVGLIMPLAPDFNPEAIAELKPAEIKERLTQQADALYEKRETELGAESMRVLERLLMLRIIDNYWIDHLTSMDNMRLGIGVQAAGQDPLPLYKREGHKLFDLMMSSIQHDIVRNIFNITVTKTPPPKQTASPMAKVAAASRGGSTTKQAEKIEGKKVGRNDPCPCGSGKKYKHCCGQNL